MANIESIVQQLRQERDRLDVAIRALTSSIDGAGSASRNSANASAAPKRRTLSVAARRKIAAAQRARWARVKAKQK
jgi:hypothetical protein